MSNKSTAVSKRSAVRRQKRKKQRRRLLGLLLLIALGVTVYFLWPSNEPPKDNLNTPLQIAYNRTPLKRTKNDIRYIVVHDTANKSFGSDAQSHFEFFNSGSQGMSADFFVDDKEILQVNDYYSYYSWHCGDGQGHHEITNQNSIGVEICVNRDGSYRRTVDNAVLLVQKLMKELGIDEAHVVRHYDASGKECPATMSEQEWKAWEKFKEKIRIMQD